MTCEFDLHSYPGSMFWTSKLRKRLHTRRKVESVQVGPKSAALRRLQSP